jgi:hypothetical protein
MSACVLFAKRIILIQNRSGDEVVQQCGPGIYLK